MEEIYKRVSIRKFKDKAVEKEKIMDILRASMQAPSACNQQPWKFYVVENKEIIEKLSLVTPYSKCVKNAPVVIVPCYREDNLVAPSFVQIDMAIACENMWLETTSIGLGGVWIGIAPKEDWMKSVHDILNLDDNIKAFSLFALGYPLEERKGEDRFKEENIVFIDL